MGRSLAVVAPVVQPDSVRVVLPSRSMKTVEIDLTEPERLPAHWVDPDAFQGAVVRIVVKYSDGDRKAADGVAAEVIRDLEKAGAFFVRKPEWIVIPTVKKRIKEVSHEQDPLEAAAAWLARMAPDHVDIDAAMAALEEAVRAAPKRPPRPEPCDLAFRSLAVTDGLPFAGRNVLEGIPDGVIGVTGRYVGATGRSNRAGKSAILDCIRFGFYGIMRELGKRGQGAVVFEGADRTVVEAGLEVDGQSRSIVRGLTATGTATLRIDGNDVGPSAGNPAIVEDIVGMTKDDFFRSVFVGQGELEEVLKRSGAELKADVMRWLDLGLWTDLEKDFAERAKVSDAEVKRCRSRRDVLQETIEAGQPDEAEIQVARDEVARLREADSDREGMARRVREIRQRLKTARVLVSASETSKNGKIAAETLAKVELELVEIKERLDKAKKAEWSAREELGRCRKNAREGFDGVCPVDKASCPRVDEINAGVEEAQARLDEAVEIHARLKTVADAAGTDSADAQTRATRLRDQVTAGQEADRMLAESGQVEDTEQLAEALQKAQEALDGVSPGAQLVDQAESTLSRLLGRVGTYREAVEKFDQVKNDLAAAEKDLRWWAYLRHVCSGLGVPSMLVESALLTIADQVNDFLGSVGLGIRLEFSPDRETKTAAKVCSVCGEPFEKNVRKCEVCKAPRGKQIVDDLRPMIREGDRVQPLELDSGAGRGIVCLATRVAIARLLGASVLFLDEVTGMLDEENLRLMVRVIAALPTMGFRQVFVITHQREVSDAIPVNVEVTRYADENRSEFGWAAQ